MNQWVVGVLRSGDIEGSGNNRDLFVEILDRSVDRRHQMGSVFQRLDDVIAEHGNDLPNYRMRVRQDTCHRRRLFQETAEEPHLFVPWITVSRC